MLDHYMALAAAFIQSHHAWAGPLLALVTFGESLVFVGFMIPATALLLLAGTLIGSGVLAAGPLLLWLIAGAIVGDAVSYWLGKWIGPALIQRWPLNRHRRSVARARLFFMRYGFVSIFLGRFLGPIRSTIPTVAGMMRMRQWAFQLANVASAVIWVFAMLAPGYLAARGASATGLMAGGQVTTVLVMVVVLSALGTVIGARFLRAATRRRHADGHDGKAPPHH